MPNYFDGVGITCEGIGISYGSLSRQKKPQYKYINKYDYIPEAFNFHKVDNEEDLFLGVELEIDSGGKDDNNAKLVVDFLGDMNAYCKHDGSIQNGFEIVTHPCTYEYHKQLSYENLFKQLVDLKYRSHDINTCGLHVHINRNYFAKDKLTQDLCISKLLYIFEKYWEKVVIIARRDSNSYARRFYLKEDETILDMYAKSKNSDKYGVINLKHKDTVEIRIFKGTLNYNTFISTLQFVNNITKIIKNVSIYNIQSLIWEDISDTFDCDLISYIKDREEKIKKEKEENDKKLELDRVNTLDGSIIRCSSGRGIRGGSSNSISITLDFNCEDFINQVNRCSDSLNRPESPRQIVLSRPEHYNRAELNNIHVNNMTIEQIKQKIKFIKEDLRRANNMETQLLQRELRLYTNKLGYLRNRR